MFNPKTAAEKIGVQPKNHQWRRERAKPINQWRREREKLRGSVPSSASFLQNTSHISMEEREIERRCRRERGREDAGDGRKTQKREREEKKKKKKKKEKKKVKVKVKVKKKVLF
jgi:hypothetical protein